MPICWPVRKSSKPPSGKHDGRAALKITAPRHVKLGTALVGMLLLAVLSTALVIHLSWSWTARRNIETVVASLNAQTANAVRRELELTFRAA